MKIKSLVLLAAIFCFLNLNQSFAEEVHSLDYLHGFAQVYLQKVADPNLDMREMDIRKDFSKGAKAGFVAAKEDVDTSEYEYKDVYNTGVRVGFEKTLYKDYESTPLCNYNETEDPDSDQAFLQGYVKGQSRALSLLTEHGENMLGFVDGYNDALANKNYFPTRYVENPSTEYKDGYHAGFFFGEGTLTGSSDDDDDPSVWEWTNPMGKTTIIKTYADGHQEIIFADGTVVEKYEDKQIETRTDGTVVTWEKIISNDNLEAWVSSEGTINYQWANGNSEQYRADGSWAKSFKYDDNKTVEWKSSGEVKILNHETNTCTQYLPDGSVVHWKNGVIVD